MAREIFTYLHLQFDVSQAKKLVDNYKVRTTKPKEGWILPDVRIDSNRVVNFDSTVIFGTLLFERQTHLLIDGNHRVSKALKDGNDVKFIILSLADTLSIMIGSEAMWGMQQRAKKLGLIPDERQESSRSGQG